MVSDVQALNHYGHLVSSCAHQFRKTKVIDEVHLTSVVLELRSLLKQASGSASSVLEEPGCDAVSASADSGQLLRSIDDIRLRMVAVLLGSGTVSVQGESPLDLTLAQGLISEPEGTTWGVLGRSCVILLPAIDDEKNPNDIARDFLSIYEHAIHADSWVIDCSAVRKFPLMLLAVILGYQDSLADLRKKLSLVWLSRSAIPDDNFPRVERLFDLIPGGDFFFSRGIKK